MYRLMFYTEEEMVNILRRSARLLSLSIDDAAIREIAQRCRKTPRVANRILKRVRDVAQVEDCSRVTPDIVHRTLRLLEVDSLGLDASDRHVLQAIVEHFHGGPVGVQTLAAVCAEEERTIEEVIEPFLLQSGLIVRTPRGREVTDKGKAHLTVSQ
ncbi:MAG: Holliday junction DNA helicase RuvB C-terminal domain-containing protein, partial [Acidobacteriota bacterium]